MTFEEAIKNNPTFIDVPAQVIELAFINRGVESTDDYTVLGLKNLELISADLYVEIATQPDISEGELSLKYSKEILMRRARNIYLKYEDDRLLDTGTQKLDLNIIKE